MTVKFCPKCGSFGIIKCGFYKNNKIKKQKYICKDCNSIFQPKVVIPSWVSKAYDDYASGMILRLLQKKYNKSIPTITKYFDLFSESDFSKKKTLKSAKQEVVKIPISLIFYGVFLKKGKR